MARNIGASCRQCRREGMKLYLKSTRCDSAKCPIESQSGNKIPGMHSWKRGKTSDYGARLREKQKVKRYYGVMEKQFRMYFQLADKEKRNTGLALLCLLERRLDNVVYKLNFSGGSRRQARQLISHGHITVNGHKVDIASYLVKPGDKIGVRAREASQTMVKTNLETGSVLPGQEWLELDTAKMEATVVAMPSREHVMLPVEEQLIIEFCSK
ncbi:MAG: 30S ribosomal protein S4 [Sedimentisphaerales bacterium]|nr:30S ribosomal protein S4 [Sedimentisphaerales bacterium]